jgi:hypothetical protein
LKTNCLSLLDIGVAISLFLFAHNSGADTLTNRPSADTTLFDAEPDNNLGATDLTSGSTGASLRSRALIQFDLDGTMPSEATANSVTLTLTVTRQPPGGVDSNYRLFRLLQPWGEGDKTGVHGAPADLGEATWNDRFAFEAGGNWSIPGAGSPTDFSSVLSASAFTDGEGRLKFASTSNLVEDVRFWLNNPTKNYGWILISDAEDVPQTVTHFGSREDPTNAPILVVDSTPAQPPRINRFAIATNSFVLAFNAQAQQSYMVQYLASLSTTNWQTLTNITAPTVAANVVVSDPISCTQRFYRVQAVPPPEKR